MTLRYDEALPIGLVREWTIRRRVKGGWYLGRDAFEVFMTDREAGEDAAVGQVVRAFVYRDGEGRLTARRRPAQLLQGHIGFLTVLSVTPYGAFLDWGLPKHLLLPRAEWHRPPQPGSRILVRVLLDGENRLTATQRIERTLEPPPRDLARRDGSVAFVPTCVGRHGIEGAVEHRWRAFLHLPGASLPLGLVRTAWVHGIDHQGRARISLSPTGAEGLRLGAERVRELAQRYGGFLPFDEDAPPLSVWEELYLSKNEFKRVLAWMRERGWVTDGPRGPTITSGWESGS